MYILNAEPLNYNPEARRILCTLGEVHDHVLDRAGLLACLKKYEVLIIRLGFNVDREVIDQGANLKAIVTATTGLDHIDINYAKQRGIEILSLQGEVDFLRSIPATAEHTWSLLLALTRRIPQAVEATRAGEWDRDSLRGHDLFGRRLGILGLGRIGEKVARYGMAFGMHVSAYDPYRIDWIPEVKKSRSLDELLGQSDVLSLHVPLNSETYHMIGAKQLSLLPISAIVINTSRGAVLDETALLEKLHDGILSGAALDVIEEERDDGRRSVRPVLSYARSFDNLLITPHIGGATIESMANTELFMADKLKKWHQLNSQE